MATGGRARSGTAALRAHRRRAGDPPEERRAEDLHPGRRRCRAVHAGEQVRLQRCARARPGRSRPVPGRRRDRRRRRVPRGRCHLRAPGLGTRPHHRCWGLGYRSDRIRIGRRPPVTRHLHRWHLLHRGPRVPGADPQVAPVGHRGLGAASALSGRHGHPAPGAAARDQRGASRSRRSRPRRSATGDRAATSEATRARGTNGRWSS